MSTDATGLLAAWRAVFGADLTATEKLVLLAVLNHWSQASQRPWPGVDRLSTVTSLHRSTVMRAIETMRAKGAIDVAKTHGKANVYTLSAAFNGALPVAQSDQSHSATGSTEQLPPVAQSDRHQSHGATATSRTERPEVSKGSKPLNGPSEGSQLARDTHAPKPSGRKRPKSTEAPIPEDWKPTEQHRELARKHDLDVDLEAIAFRGFFEGKTVTSPNGRFATWLVKSVQMGAARGTGAAKPGKQRGVAPVSSAEDFANDPGVW